MIFCDKGKLTIDGATITNGKAPNFIGGVYMTSSASFEMKSGSITGNKNAKGYQNDEYLQYSSDLWIGANANGALTAINGGTIGNVFVNANAWSASNPGSFTMNGGTVKMCIRDSYHTIIPGFLLKDGAAVGPFGVMGAFMQPQGQTEILVNTLDYHMNPQEALDAPRIQWIGGRRLELEREAGEAIADELRAMGHEVTVVDDRISMGRGQIIWRGEDGVYTAGTEPRCDGAVAAW